MESIKVIIVDDSDFVRDGMKIILDIDDDFDVIGTASNGQEAVELARANKCDVVLMDIQMPVMDGIEATKVFVEEDLGKVMILTTFDDDELVDKAIKNGAKGYLIKNHKPEELKQMIRSIHQGVHIMDEKVFDKFVDVGIKPNSNFNKENYTARELEIIEAVASGLSNKEIAEKLFISEGTVKNYISSILLKEGLSHRTQLAVYYLTGRKGV
ncbi:MAG: response regulator transcription factor [Saccharofermentans sp.]|nr:response regulator transcription factor [Saccharofermentans sp.]